MVGDEWIENEVKFQESLGRTKIPYQPCTTITVKVLRGKKISVGFFHDLCDKPDVRVYVGCQAAIGRKKFKTKVSHNTSNPEWNESFSFIMPDDTENATIKFDVYEQDFLKHDPYLGYGSFQTEKLVFGKLEPFTVNLGERGTIEIELLKEWRPEPDCRMSLGLADGEKSYRLKRKPKIMAAIQRLLRKEDGPGSLQETPTVALAMSGGGYRAVAACCGAMEALAESGILDTLMYITGLSGSAWYMSSAYQRRAINDLGSLIDHHDWMRKNAATDVIRSMFDLEFLKRYRDYRNFKIENKQKTTFVDVFGFSLGEKFLGGASHEAKLSALKHYVGAADVPFPVITCAHVRDKLPMSVFWEEVEMTPFEISVPCYGINIPTEKFNSLWANGILQQELPEPPLHYIMGTCGNAFAIQLSSISDQTETSEAIQEYIDSYYEKPATLESESEEEDDSEEDEDLVDSAPLPNIKKDTQNFSAVDDSCFDEIEEITSSQDAIPLEQQEVLFGRNFVVDRTAKVNNLASTFMKLHKFHLNTQPVDTAQETGRIKHTASTKKRTMALCDSGIECNLPAVHAMRPHRTVDVLIMVDCAPYAREGFLNLESFATVPHNLCLHGLDFPFISMEKIAEEPFREFYLFEDPINPDGPVVIWFTLANEKFRNLENPPRRPGYPKPDPVDSGKVKFNDFSVTPDVPEFATTRLSSDPLTFDRLRELMKFNILTNMEIVKEKIARKVKHLKEKKS